MHQPVMLMETVDRLDVKPGGTYLDCTLGDGGHSAEILRRGGRNCSLLALDRDSDALMRAMGRLKDFPAKVTYAHCNHAHVDEKCFELGFDLLDGAVIDTGVSSEQLDDADRGFSFMRDGPLDMRMDQSHGETAADLVANLSRDELAALFRDLGEEPAAWHIAAAIVQERARCPIDSTKQLADLIERTLGPVARMRHRNPSTRVFQALRMRVNHELESLGMAIDAILPRLKIGGRLAVITFESISDRLVKGIFAAHVGHIVSLQQGGAEWQGEEPRVEKTDRHAVVPSAEEIASNPRARSAKLRAVERISPDSRHERTERRRK